METIGKRIRSARKACGYTMQQLHDLTGLSTGNISDIENDRNTPSVASLIVLGEALRRSLDWILTGKDAKTRSDEQVAECDGISLSPMECDVIAMLRLLNDHDRKNAVDIITMLYEQTTGEKVSIYSTYIEDENKRRKSGPDQRLEAHDGTA